MIESSNLDQTRIGVDCVIGFYKYERERERTRWIKIDMCQKLGVKRTINNDTKLIGFIIKFMKNYILSICDLIEI